MILERTTYKQHHCISLKSHQWRYYSLDRKMIYQVALILILCQREVDGRKKLYIFLYNDISPIARKDVLWCFSQGGFFTNYCIPEVRVDPDGRCAAMLVYGTHMVILPFRRDVMVEEGDNLAGTRYFIVRDNKCDVTNSPKDCNLLQ